MNTKARALQHNQSVKFQQRILDELLFLNLVMYNRLKKKTKQMGLLLSYKVHLHHTQIYIYIYIIIYIKIAKIPFFFCLFVNSPRCVCVKFVMKSIYYSSKNSHVTLTSLFFVMYVCVEYAIDQSSFGLMNE